MALLHNSALDPKKVRVNWCFFNLVQKLLSDELLEFCSATNPIERAKVVSMFEFLLFS